MDTPNSGVGSPRRVLKMSDHKHPGRSKGPDYKEAQHAGSKHRGLFPAKLQRGTRIKGQDGNVYEYDEHGAMRRAEAGE